MRRLPKWKPLRRPCYWTTSAAMRLLSRPGRKGRRRRTSTFCLAPHSTCRSQLQGLPRPRISTAALPAWTPGDPTSFPQHTPLRRRTKLFSSTTSPPGIPIDKATSTLDDDTIQQLVESSRKKLQRKLLTSGPSGGVKKGGSTGQNKPKTAGSI